MTRSGMDLTPLARPSGALAMLALDQRESLRAMLRSAAGDRGSDARAIPDQALVDLKVEASAVLSDVGSAVLLVTFLLSATMPETLRRRDGAELPQG